MSPSDGDDRVPVCAVQPRTQTTGCRTRCQRLREGRRRHTAGKAGKAPSRPLASKAVSQGLALEALLASCVPAPRTYGPLPRSGDPALPTPTQYQARSSSGPAINSQHQLSIRTGDLRVFLRVGSDQDEVEVVPVGGKRRKPQAIEGVGDREPPHGGRSSSKLHVMKLVKLLHSCH